MINDKKIKIYPKNSKNWLKITILAPKMVEVCNHQESCKKPYGALNTQKIRSAVPFTVVLGLKSTELSNFIFRDTALLMWSLFKFIMQWKSFGVSIHMRVGNKRFGVGPRNILSLRIIHNFDFPFFCDWFRRGGTAVSVD